MLRACPTVFWGWAGGVYGTGVAMTLNRGPQIVELIRQADASGVSVAFVGASAPLGTALWIIYYSGEHLWAPLVSTVLRGPRQLRDSALATWRHRQARNVLIAEQVFAV